MHHPLDRTSRREFLDSISTPSSRMHVAYAFRMHTCVLACLSLPVQLPACAHTLVFGDLVRIFFLYKSLKKRFIWGWSWFEAFSFTNSQRKASFEAWADLKHLALQILQENLHLRLDLVWIILLYRSFRSLRKRFICGWSWFGSFSFTNPPRKVLSTWRSWSEASQDQAWMTLFLKDLKGKCFKPALAFNEALFKGLVKGNAPNQLQLQMERYLKDDAWSVRLVRANH